MNPIIKLKAEYNIELLKRDLNTIEDNLWHEHFDKSLQNDGGWSAVPLISAGGKMDASSLRMGSEAYLPTPLLDLCPYYREVIDGFQCEKLRVRLMKLKAGKVIKEHKDPRHSWVSGQVRLHIPIITNEKVYFHVEGRRAPMMPGELWYIDVQRHHAVRNDSDQDRVHLVLDLVLNDRLRAMFPRETAVDVLRGMVARISYQFCPGDQGVHQQSALRKLLRK